MGNFEFLEIPDIKRGKNPPPDELKKKEGEKILGLLDARDYVVLLDEKGKTYSSREFAKLLQDKMLQRVKNITFIIGGAYGFSGEVYERAHQQLSLSRMTFPHDLVRLLFIEQLYRGLSILQNLPYHHD